MPCLPSAYPANVLKILGAFEHQQRRWWRRSEGGTDTESNEGEERRRRLAQSGCSGAGTCSLYPPLLAGACTAESQLRLRDPQPLLYAFWCTRMQAACLAPTRQRISPWQGVKFRLQRRPQADVVSCGAGDGAGCLLAYGGGAASEAAQRSRRLSRRATACISAALRGGKEKRSAENLVGVKISSWRKG